MLKGKDTNVQVLNTKIFEFLMISLTQVHLWTGKGRFGDFISLTVNYLAHVMNFVVPELNLILTPPAGTRDKFAT